MKKNYFFLFFIVLLFNTCPMFSFTSVESSVLDINKVDGDDFDEIQIWILSGGDIDRARVRSARVLSIKEEQKIALYQNSSYLKANVLSSDRINIKVLSSETESPVYMRQFIPGSSEEMLINTTKWSSGYYNIIFTSPNGVVIAKGTVYIR